MEDGFREPGSFPRHFESGLLVLHDPDEQAFVGVAGLDGRSGMASFEESVAPVDPDAAGLFGHAVALGAGDDMRMGRIFASKNSRRWASSEAEARELTRPRRMAARGTERPHPLNFPDIGPDAAQMLHPPQKAIGGRPPLSNRRRVG